MTKKYKVEAFESIHQSAKALHAVGAISKTTLREYDEACLSMPDQIPAEQIKQLRESSHVSQPVFARYPEHQRVHRQKMGVGRETA